MPFVSPTAPRRSSLSRFATASLPALMFALAVFGVGRSRPATAQESGWPLETLTLAGGTSIQGVSLTSDRQNIDFAEVVRPPGKPMFVVIRRIAHGDIIKRKQLSSEQRSSSLKQLARFRDRVRIEQANMEGVTLQEAEFEGFRCRRHDDAWFTVWSTADEETTRRCVVRIDQIFRAYRQLFPPKERNRPLRILLLDSLEEYGDYLRRHGLNVQNPAFYSQKRNLIVAASEVGDFGSRLAEIRKRHDRRIQELERLNRQFLVEFQSLRTELQAAGFKPDEITFEKTARMRTWNDERERKLKQIATANRRNDARFHDLTQRMFRRLQHEAFHAYIENYVYSQRSSQSLPRWYDEGLAQVFESGQLEAGLLRIDAPDQARLKRLKVDFQTRPRLHLARLVATQPRDFIDAHETPQANRYYLHSWAVAYYLTFIAPRTAEQIDQFAQDSTRDPRERLEKFAGVRLEELEDRWRSAIIGLKPE